MSRPGGTTDARGGRRGAIAVVGAAAIALGLAGCGGTAGESGARVDTDASVGADVGLETASESGGDAAADAGGAIDVDAAPEGEVLAELRGLPLPPGAEPRLAFGGGRTVSQDFEVELTAAELLAFVEAELPAAGLTLDEGSLDVARETVAAGNGGRIGAQTADGDSLDAIIEARGETMIFSYLLVLSG